MILVTKLASVPRQIQCACLDGRIRRKHGRVDCVVQDVAGTEQRRLVLLALQEARRDFVCGIDKFTGGMGGDCRLRGRPAYDVRRGKEEPAAEREGTESA